MTSWNTYGVSITDESAKDDVIDALEDLGLKVWESGENVKATHGGRENIGPSDVKRALRPFRGDSVSGFVHVDANDTSDTASGQIYKAEDGSWERGRSRWSDGESSRRDWMGLSYDGVNVDGGKYY